MTEFETKLINALERINHHLEQIEGHVQLLRGHFLDVMGVQNMRDDPKNEEWFLRIGT